jgi:hypothetical protein
MPKSPNVRMSLHKQHANLMQAFLDRLQSVQRANGAFSPPTSRRRLCVTLTEYIFERMYNSSVESDDRFALVPLKDRKKNGREKIFSFKGECSLVDFAKP